MSALLPTYARSGLSFARGEGAFLFTEAGERYLDFSSGIAVTALGHAHPRLIEALEAEGLITHLLPDWERVRCRPQRNAVHIWTVDRHLIATAVQASEMTRRVHRSGGRIVEIPITFIEREFGASKMSKRIVIEALVEVTAWGIKDRLKRSKR